MIERLDLAHPQPKRDEALAHIRAGHSVRSAAAKVGVPKSTVHDWVRQARPIPGESAPDESEGLIDGVRGETVLELPDNRSPADPDDTDEHASKVAREQEGESTTGTDGDPWASAPLPSAVAPLPEDVSPRDLQSVQDPQERHTPPHRLYLEAIYRYVNLLAHGVHPTHALRAAQSIDAGFSPDPDETERWQTALEAAGLNPRSMPMAETWLFANPNPPLWVQRLVDKWAMSPDDIRELSTYIYQTRYDAYLEGLNEERLKLRMDPLPEITDESVLAQLRGDALTSAEAIADTWHRDLASEAGSAWLDAAAKSTRYAPEGSTLRGLTLQSRQAAVESEIGQWVKDRAGWKSLSIASTEANAAYNRAILGFAQQNGATMGQVTPDECECQGCLDLVGLGIVPLDQLALVDLPLHPGCFHKVETVYPEQVSADVYQTAVSDAAEQASA